MKHNLRQSAVSPNEEESLRGLASRHEDEREGWLPRAVAKILLDDTAWEGLWGFNVAGVGKRGCPGGSGVVKAARRTSFWEPAVRAWKAAAVWKARFRHSYPQSWPKTVALESLGAGNGKGQGGCGSFLG